MDALKAALLATYNEAEKDPEYFDAGLLNESSKLAGNQAFIEESSEFDSVELRGSKSIIESLNENFEESQFVINEEQLLGPARCRTTLQSICKAWISNCSTENVKLKLISIFKGQALVLKKRWGKDKILAILLQP